MPQLRAANGITAASGEGFAVAVGAFGRVFLSLHVFFHLC